MSFAQLDPRFAKKAPFVYPGGKSRCADVIWDALGDVDHYVEPLGGSLACLLLRPDWHRINEAYVSETVNDAHGLLVNAWRGIVKHPDAVAEAASILVSEIEVMAAQLALIKWKENGMAELLAGDRHACDVEMAGLWLYGMACWIGGGFCDGKGPWTTDETGRVYKQGKRGGRESGICRKVPHLANDGQGTNNPTLREPGVKRQVPHLGTDGNGVNTPLLREPGVTKQIPYLHTQGQETNHGEMREPGVSKRRPVLGNDRGTNHPQLRESGVENEEEFHPVTMPKLRLWMKKLQARLRHVRVLWGGWERLLTPAASLTLSVRKPGGVCGVFLDPPYSAEADRDMGLYVEDSGEIAHDVREWCIRNGHHKYYRIVLAGFDTEHRVLAEEHGWREVEWYTTGHLTGGYANQGKVAGGTQQHRERLWMSPHCLVNETPAPRAQQTLWDDEDE